ncbi:ATP-binding protein [Spirillospora sp. CA-108201]
MTSAAPAQHEAPSNPPGEPQFPQGIALVGSRMRSTNLERDVEDELHSPYIGARAIDALERLTSALGDLGRTRSWSFTGPYGSGKSTLANIIDALLGGDVHRRAQAETVLDGTSNNLAQRLKSHRDALAGEAGFLGAVATARREPLVATLSRALHTAARRRWGQHVPEDVHEALAVCAEAGATPKHILHAVNTLCEQQPVLLVIDEFGKTLEHLAGHSEFASARDDLFLLQELAEMSAGRRGLRLFMMTLQHMSFMDYAVRSSELQTREWAKIQGRFEDITFVPHLGDAVELMRQRISHGDVSQPNSALIRNQARAAATAWREQGLNTIVDLTANHFEDLYPLHPLTVVAAPYLAAQIGQHDRSLTNFLNSDEPHTVRRSLAMHSHEKPDRAATIKIAQLYDFFIAAGRTSLLASTNASRWIEIDSRINEANGLSPADQELLRTIGILNLIDSDGALRATAGLVHFALHEPSEEPDAHAFSELETQLQSLVDRGLVVHRRFNGEFRIWRGSDVDIDARLEEVTSHLDAPAVISKLGEHLPLAVAAGRHSQVTGMLRALFVRVTGPDTEMLIGPDELSDHADGLLIFHLGMLENRPTVETTLPVVLGVTQEPDLVLRVASYFVALQELLLDKLLDPVARQEIRERATAAKAELMGLLDTAFYPQTQRATWYLWHSGASVSQEDGEVIESRSLSGLASIACDRVFHASPHIRNEMLGRHELTSQAAKARRELLTAMLLKSRHKHLDIQKYPAERAMYSGALAYMGLHREKRDLPQGESPTSLLEYGFSRPGAEHRHAQPVWNALEDALAGARARTGLDQIFRAVMIPPYGVKAGTVPLLVVTALIVRNEDVALFEEGSYLPRLSSDVVERMIKAPHRFAVKFTPGGQGLRRTVLKDLSLVLGVETPPSQALRNPALLAVVRNLLERVMTLSPYARRTRRLSPDALAVRSALQEARDPDDLLFVTLPEALGLEPIAADAKRSTRGNKGYADRLATAVDEISGIDRALRDEVIQTLAAEFRLPATLPELREGLAARLRGFTDVALGTELRGFVAIALNETLPDEDWLDPLLVRLANSALGDWSDKDVAMFPQRVQEMASALDRVSHLHQNRSSVGPQEGALETRLLTLTSSDGEERRTLLYIPAIVRKDVDALTVRVLREAESSLGEDGARILLAALTERIAEPTTPRGKRGASDHDG